MTKLLVVRHGRALDADAFAATGQSDDARPLTDEGAREMTGIAHRLRGLVDRVDHAAPSPLTRARQTAEILARAYGVNVGPPVEELRPESSLESFVAWAAKQTPSGVMLIVGHAPHLNRLVLWLISGVDREGIALKKGGACLLEFDGRPESGTGVLRWLLTPADGAASFR